MRMRSPRILCLVTLAWVAAVSGVHAQQAPVTSSVLMPVPRLVWFSGAFRPADHLPVAALESVTVAVYREREGGEVVWSETQNVAMTPDGRYNLLMGSTVSEGMPLDLFTRGEPRWIGVTVNRPGEVEQPRVHLASVPYALKAADTDTLGGKPASAYMLADAPAVPLDAKGQPSRNAALPNTAGTAGYVGMFVDSANLGNSVLFQNGASVGLGTTAPHDALHVAVTNGTGTATGFAVQNLSGAAGAYSGMLFYDQNGVLGQFQGFNNATHEYRINNVAAAGRINFMIGSSSKFLVANNGNVGLGVPVPGAKLDVAGDINTTTHYNIGSSRVLGVASGVGNPSIFVGAGAGQVSTGSDNAFVGTTAGSDNTGSENSFLGTLAGRFNTGSGNVFVGQRVAQGNTGSFNSFVGASAGVFNSGGAANTFMGASAGYANQTGSSNASFGYRAGASSTNSCCNAFFGAYSANSSPEGSGNTLIGYFTELGAAGLTNASALGSQATVSQSNSLVLGSIAGENTALADTRVGIGTVAPSSKLHVKGAGSDPGGVGDLRITGTGQIGSGVTLEATGSGGRTYTWLSTADNTGGGGFGPGRLAVYDATANAYRMVIDGAGNVGIGTFTPDHLLSVNGTAAKIGGGSWDVFSDERLKNITGRFTRGLDAVLQLQPIRFEYKPDNALGLKAGGEYIGFSAQAVQKLIPEAVTTNDKGYLLVNNDPILWSMVNALQEQQAVLGALQRQNTALELRLAALEAPPPAGQAAAGQPPAVQPPTAPPGGGRRGTPPVPPLTPSPSRVLAPGAAIEKIAGDFIFTEGPTSDKDGNVYFVDQDNNRIMKYDTSGTLTTFMQPSGYANGMTFDNEGHLIAAADEKNEMWSIDVATKKATVLFSTYQGKLLNGPNDVWVHPTTGRIYFTDPYYARKWWTRGPKENLETVYMYSPEDKKVTRLDDDLAQANGIIGTPDGRTLYVSDIRNRQTFAYDIAADGRLTNKRLFCALGSDGMTIDSEGNVYLTAGRAVEVFTAAGERIETIAPPETPANVVFGGKDRQTLFITARTGFYAVKMRVKGVGPQ